MRTTGLTENTAGRLIGSGRFPNRGTKRSRALAPVEDSGENRCHRCIPTPRLGHTTMKPRFLLLMALLPSLAAAVTGASATAPPTDWVDPATGHRVIRLSGDEGGA